MRRIVSTFIGKSAFAGSRSPNWGSSAFAVPLRTASLAVLSLAASSLAASSLAALSLAASGLIVSSLAASRGGCYLRRHERGSHRKNPQLRHHRPYRPRQIDAGRPPDPAHRGA